MMGWRLGFRVQLVGLTVAIVALTAASLTAYQIWEESESAYAQALDKGGAIARSLALNLIDPIYLLDLERMRVALRAVKAIPEVTVALALDPEGRVFTDHSGEGRVRASTLTHPQVVAEAQARGAAAFERAGSLLVIAKPVRLGDGEIIGYAYFEMSLDSVRAHVAREAERAAQAGVLLSLLAFALAYRLSRRFSGPVQALVRAMAAVRDGGLGTRVAMERHDELGQLAAGFNAMVASLQARTEEVRETEARLKLALEASRLALWDYDVASGRVYLDERWSALLGGSGQPTVTGIEELAALVHPEDRGAVRQALRAAFKSESGRYSVEHRVATRDGAWKWIESQG